MALVVWMCLVLPLRVWLSVLGEIKCFTCDSGICRSRFVSLFGQSVTYNKPCMCRLRQFDYVDM